MKDRTEQTTKSGRLALFALICAALLMPVRPAAADKSSPVLSVRIGGDRLLVIALRTGEIHLDGTFKSRAGHSLAFDSGKLVLATDERRQSQRVKTATIDASGKLVIGSGKNEWQPADGQYVGQGDPEPQPDPEPEPQPGQGPTSFKVQKGKIVEVTY